ncbi:MAG TPA: DUF2071 domain-containing protein [Gemmatimonadaceae bacterium]|nr:DUF2071 domain-containing protein [Gemmatimonadaceae bacterium]
MRGRKSGTDRQENGIETRLTEGTGAGREGERRWRFPALDAPIAHRLAAMACTRLNVSMCPERESDRAPASRPFLTAEWRDLAMLNFAVSSDLLQPLVPAGTELDKWRGTTYLSVIGFRFLSTRVHGVAVPGHRHFEEVNLRFYVRRLERDGWRRGVVFIRELVPRWAIAWAARALYNEPYAALPMRHAITRAGDGATVRFEWRRGRSWEGLSLRTSQPPEPLRAESEAEFISEHFYGYTRQRNGSTMEYRVEHPPWRVANADEAVLRADVSTLHAGEFADALGGAPRSAFLAQGSPVAVYPPIRLPDT